MAIMGPILMANDLQPSHTEFECVTFMSVADPGGIGGLKPPS